MEDHQKSIYSRYQPKKKTLQKCYHDITIIIVDHFLNTKTKKNFKIVYSTYYYTRTSNAVVKKNL